MQFGEALLSFPASLHSRATKLPSHTTPSPQEAVSPS